MNRTACPSPPGFHLLALGVAVAVSACGGQGPAPEPPPADEPTVTSVAPPSAPPPPGPTAPPPPPADAWTAGIVDVERQEGGVSTLLDARVAAHPDFDRFVLQFDTAGVPGYHLEYVDRPIYQCGSGNTVEVDGDGWLLIRLYPANAHTEEGRPTIEERSFRPNLPNIRQLRLICDFEAYVEWVVGVGSPNPYRVMELGEPARLVIDILR